MRVIRSAGQNVSPSDDGRLFDQIFTDGLFEETTITHLGANNVALGAMYGIICGRDFTAEAQTVAVELPEDDAGTTGYIYIEIDTSSDDVITIGSALAPFTPTYEDLNTNGAVAQMIIAEYVASSVAITSLTPVYVMATSGSVLPGSVATVEVSPAVANHAVGDFILYGGQLYSVTAPIDVGETLTVGTNITAKTVGEELTTLKNGLTARTVTLSASDMNLPSGVTLYQTNYLTIIGKMVICNFSLKMVNVTGQQNITNYFPAAYAPRNSQNGTAETGLGDGKCQPISIYPSRSLQFYPVNSGTTYAIGQIVYALS